MPVMHINWGLDWNFSLMIGSDIQLALRDKMAVLGAVYFYTTFTVFTILSLILYVQFKTADL